MIYPKFLEKQDTIGVTAPSDGNSDEIRQKRVDNAISNFNKRGYNIIETANTRTSIKGRSSSKEKRAQEFISLIQNKEVKAIFAARRWRLFTRNFAIYRLRRNKEKSKMDLWLFRHNRN